MINKIRDIYNVLKFAIKYAWKNYHFLVPPKKFLKGIIRLIFEFGDYVEWLNIINAGNGTNDIDAYKIWINRNEKSFKYKKFKYNPLISIVIPHYNVPAKILKECLKSILKQSYKNFEICIADDRSTNKESIRVLKIYKLMHPKIKVVWRKEHGGISAATNSAIEIAKGEFIAFMDSDDTLSKDALYWNVEALNNKKFDLIYSDEDKLNFDGERVEPHFKPGWNETLLLSVNYICRFVVARASLVKEHGGCRSRFDGAQDHDFLLRLTEKTDNIYNISKMLYHWRMIPGSASVSEAEKPYVVQARKEVIKEALKRRNLQGKLIPVENNSSFFNILFENNNEKVSILIPTHDHIDYLKPCIESIYEKTTYKNFEIILIDHNSDEKESLEYFEECKQKYNNFKVIRYECEFNHSYLNNEAAKIATGDYLILLNSDVEIITPNWIEFMLGYARQEKIGCVGANLLYSDNSVQHAGIRMYGDGIATHVFGGFTEEMALKKYRYVVASNYSGVTFACAMVNKEKYNMIGGMNEKLPADYNDVDFCLEMLKAGFNNVYVPAVKLYHYESKIRGLASMSSSNYSRWRMAIEYMKKKWGDILYEDKYISPYYLENM